MKSFFVVVTPLLADLAGFLAPLTEVLNCLEIGDTFDSHFDSPEKMHIARKVAYDSGN